MLRRVALATGATTSFYLHRKRTLPDAFVLKLDLTEAPRDVDVARVITDAAKDPRICGLVARLGSGGTASLSLAQAQELSDAVGRFRSAKPSAPTFAYAPAYDSSAKYMLACRFGSVVQQPGGGLCLPSASVELSVVENVLARAGLRRRVRVFGASLCTQPRRSSTQQPPEHAHDTPTLVTQRGRADRASVLGTSSLTLCC